MKDESNERLEKELQSLMEFMDKEGRGFIFATLPKADSKHKSFLCVQGAGSSWDEAIEEFWAGLLAIVMNMRTQLPDDKHAKYKQCYKAFLQATMEQFNMGAIEL